LSRLTDLRRLADLLGGCSRTLLLALALLLLSFGEARGAGDPSLDWWTIETTHFRVHYERGLEPVAERVARLAESIHKRLIGPLGHTPDERTEILLTDNTDDANGSATALPYNAVRLFVTAPRDLSALGDYDDWYLGLLTHEYTHILHIDSISGVPSLINSIIGKTLAPNQFQPRWIIEGLAVVAESKFSSAGRIRSSLFDTYMRADVLADNIARLDQLSSNPRRWPQGTLFYLYGSRFMQWIADVYGMDVLRAVAVDYGASILPWGFNRAIRRQTGRTYVQLYEGFKKSLKRRYRKQIRAVRRRGLREGKRISYHGRGVAYPKLLPRTARYPDGGDRQQYQLLYYRNDFDSRSGQYLMRLPRSGKKLASSLPREQLVARSSGEDPSSVTPTGELLFSSVVPFKRVYWRTDLFKLPRGKRAPSGEESFRKRLTVGMRASAPAASPDGRHIAFTVNAAGTTTLKIAELTADGLRKIRSLDTKRKRFDQAFTPVFSPDGRKLAYSVWSAGGYRDLRVVELASGRIDQLTHDRALDTGPCWSPDGERLYFSSDRTGIFNIYELTLADRSVKQVTNVRGAALMPTVSEDGTLLVYVGYTKAGFDLFAMPLERARFLEAPAAANNRPAPNAEPPPVRWRKSRYNPLPTLRPYTFGFDYAPGNFGENALTITATGGDIVGHHAIGATIVADPAAPAPQASLDYHYMRLPVDLSMRLSSRVSPRTDYRISDQKPGYIEHSYGIRSAVSYRHHGEFASQRVGLSYTAAITESELPVASVQPLDPYASPTRLPFRGLIAIAHLGYAVSNVEGGFTAPGSVDGFSLSLGLDIGDEAIGSSESVYSGSFALTGYVSMPWSGDHVLALRASGAMAKGSYSRRGIYFLGGYNLENISVLDSITSGVLQGAFVLRGYPPSAFKGSTYLLGNAEYRLPIYEVDRGVSTLPVYLRRIDGNIYLDYGGAFDRLDYENIELLSKGALIHSEQLQTGAGAELWLSTTIGYGMDVQFRVGYSFGFSSERVPGGQAYFLASNTY